MQYLHPRLNVRKLPVQLQNEKSVFQIFYNCRIQSTLSTSLCIIICDAEVEMYLLPRSPNLKVCYQILICLQLLIFIFI